MSGQHTRVTTPFHARCELDARRLLLSLLRSLVWPCLRLTRLCDSRQRDSSGQVVETSAVVSALPEDLRRDFLLSSLSNMVASVTFLKQVWLVWLPVACRLTAHADCPA